MKNHYPVRIEINDEVHQLLVTAEQSLLDVLRFKLDLRGAKRGCDTGHCGLCTVLLKRPGADGEAQPVVACLLLALEADGCRVTTIEGLRQGGQLHPMQRSFIELGGLQCGYCTSGMIMSAVALYRQNPRPSEAEAREAIAGNMCRCTGYAKVVEAICKAHSYDE